MSTDLATTATPGFPAITPEMLESLDVEKLEKLLDLQRTFQADQAKRDFAAAMAKFQADCPTVHKKSKSYTGTYASLEDIRAEIREPLQSHGFSYTFDTEQADGKLTVLCKVAHAAGHSETSRFTCPVDHKASGMNVAQKEASANSYAKRYALCNAFGIVCGDEDDDGQGTSEPPTSEPPAVITQDQADDIREKCRELGADATTRLLAALDVRDFESIPAASLDRVHRSIDKKLAAKREGGVTA